MSQMRARVVAPSELTPTDLAAWSTCAASSLEPNPFFEPGWLLPALEHLDTSPTTRLVLAEHGGVVHACVPVTMVAVDTDGAGGHGAHTALVTMVAPTVLALGTPLVTRAGGHDAVANLLTGLSGEAARQGAGLVIMEWLGNDGPVSQLLKDAAQTIRPLIEFDSWERAFLRRRTDDEERYWLRGVGKNRLRTIHQHRRRLDAALGTGLSLRRRTDSSAIDAFLRLEALGWKGHRPDGLAFRRRAGSARFFEEVCRRYIDGDRMWFLSLEGDGAPIAMICCIHAGEGVFAFRTAYDEEFAAFGPGGRDPRGRNGGRGARRRRVLARHMCCSRQRAPARAVPRPACDGHADTPGAHPRQPRVYR